MDAVGIVVRGIDRRDRAVDRQAVEQIRIVPAGSDRLREPAPEPRIHFDQHWFGRFAIPAEIDLRHAMPTQAARAARHPVRSIAGASTVSRSTPVPLFTGYVRRLWYVILARTWPWSNRNVVQ